MAENEIATSAKAASEVCVQTAAIATRHQTIGEVKSMPATQAICQIIGYIDLVQSLLLQWQEVEEAGWMAGYQWNTKIRLASTATGSALQQAQANCWKILHWIESQTEDVPIDTIGQVTQAIISLDDQDAFIEFSIESIKGRVPNSIVVRIDDERRYILEGNAEIAGQYPPVQQTVPETSNEAGATPTVPLPANERKKANSTEPQKDWERVFRDYESFTKPNGFVSNQDGPWRAKFEAFWKSRRDLQAWNLPNAWKNLESARKRLSRRIQ